MRDPEFPNPVILSEREPSLRGKREEGQPELGAELVETAAAGN